MFTSIHFRDLHKVLSGSASQLERILISIAKNTQVLVKEAGRQMRTALKDAEEEVSACEIGRRKGAYLWKNRKYKCILVRKTNGEVCTSEKCRQRRVWMGLASMEVSACYRGVKSGLSGWKTDRQIKKYSRETGKQKVVVAYERGRQRGASAWER